MCLWAALVEQAMFRTRVGSRSCLVYSSNHKRTQQRKKKFSRSISRDAAACSCCCCAASFSLLLLVVRGLSSYRRLRLCTRAVVVCSTSRQHFFFFLKSSGGWVKIKLKLPHVHASYMSCFDLAYARQHGVRKRCALSSQRYTFTKILKQKEF